MEQYVPEGEAEFQSIIRVANLGPISGPTDNAFIGNFATGLILPHYPATASCCVNITGDVFGDTSVFKIVYVGSDTQLYEFDFDWDDFLINDNVTVTANRIVEAVPDHYGGCRLTTSLDTVNFQYMLLFQPDVPALPDPLPVTIVGASQDVPLWCSSVKYDSAPVSSTNIHLVGSSTSSPIWCTTANFQGKINSGADSTGSFHGTIDNIATMIRRPSRSEDTTYNIPGQFGLLADTNVIYSDRYQRKSLLDKLSVMFVYYSGSLRYKVKYPLSTPYTTLGASLPLLQSVSNTPTLTAPYNHIEMGMAVTDQVTFSMLEFEHPFESTVPMALTGMHTLVRPVPLLPLNHGGESLNVTPLVSSLFESAAPDFCYYGLLPPPNRVIAYKLTGKHIFI